MNKIHSKIQGHCQINLAYFNSTKVQNSIDRLNNESGVNETTKRRISTKLTYDYQL